MSEQKINEMERDLHLVKALMPPLVEKMDQSTKAQIQLTGEIKNLVDVIRKVETVTERHDHRLDHLEKLEYARQSKDDANKWKYQAVGGVVITIVITAIAGLVMKSPPM